MMNIKMNRSPKSPKKQAQGPVVQLLDNKFLGFNTVAPWAQLTNTPNWRQIPRNAFGKACPCLRDNILSKSSKTFDLSQLTIHISKIDGSKFTDRTNALQL